jgi:2-aminoadipate transaminase
MGARTNAPPISWLMDQALSHPHIISLAAGFTDNPSLPVKEARAVLNEILGEPGAARAALQYGNTIGDAGLREITAKRISDQDRRLTLPAGGMKSKAYPPDQILITHGSQQLLYLLTEVLFDPGDIVLVEDPTYFVYLGMAQSHGVRCRGIRITGDGIDCEHLESVLSELKQAGEIQRVKMLYLVTYFQNPSGTTTSIETKAAALRILRRFEKDAGHPIYLLEDAAYRELRFAGGETPSCLTLPGADRRVIYTSTYSKPFATGIRVGYGWLPKRLMSVVTRIKGNHDFGTSHILQQTLARVIQTGRLDQHLIALQKRYHDKASVMVQALKRHCSDLLTWNEPDGGLYVWARLRGVAKSGPKSKLFQAAVSENVLYVPGALCYADDPSRRKPDQELRLSFGNATESDITKGIARLAKAIRSI